MRKGRQAFLEKKLIRPIDVKKAEEQKRSSAKFWRRFHHPKYFGDHQRPFCFLSPDFPVCLGLPSAPEKNLLPLSSPSVPAPPL